LGDEAGRDVVGAGPEKNLEVVQLAGVEVMSWSCSRRKACSSSKLAGRLDMAAQCSSW
jgi:hypothetical protein